MSFIGPIEIVHYMTQNAQPYGSRRRCCERCGAMCVEPFTDRIVATFTDKNPTTHEVPPGFRWCSSERS